MGRASIIAYFVGTDMIAVPLLVREGLITFEIIFRALMFLPALIAGVWVGARCSLPVGSNRKRARPSRHPLEVVGPPARCEIAGAATLSTITLRHAGRPDCTARSSAPPTSAALVTSSPYAPKAPAARS